LIHENKKLIEREKKLEENLLNHENNNKKDSTQLSNKIINLNKDLEQLRKEN
jgi:hypothetical protein